MGTLRIFPAKSAASRRERGQSLLEFALVIPIFLILVMGIIDFSLGLKSWITITNASREAARYAAVSCSSGVADTDDVKERAVTAASGLSIATDDVTVTNCGTGRSSQSVAVSVDYEYDLVTPLGGLLSLIGGGMPGTLSLNSEADMRME
jgi:Flp pilus assembly protein TadG